VEGLLTSIYFSPLKQFHFSLHIMIVVQCSDMEGWGSVAKMKVKTKVLHCEVQHGTTCLWCLFIINNNTAWAFHVSLQCLHNSMFGLPMLITISAFSASINAHLCWPCSYHHTIAVFQTAQMCSKMFIGGLNWDTTDGTWSCTAPCSMGRTESVCHTRVAQKILQPVWQAKHLCHHVGLYWPF
jgi:hypothetical protein